MGQHIPSIETTYITNSTTYTIVWDNIYQRLGQLIPLNGTVNTTEWDSLYHKVGQFIPSNGTIYTICCPNLWDNIYHQWWYKLYHHSVEQDYTIHGIF